MAYYFFREDEFSGVFDVSDWEFDAGPMIDEKNLSEAVSDALGNTLPSEMCLAIVPSQYEYDDVKRVESFSGPAIFEVSLCEDAFGCDHPVWRVSIDEFVKDLDDGPASRKFLASELRRAADLIDAIA